MTAVELRQLYEKLYFHELEAREKLQARLQLPLTLLIAIGSGVVFLFQNFDYQVGSYTPLRVTFLFCFCAGVVILVLGGILFVKAYHNHAYRFLSDSSKTDAYRQELEDLYKDYDHKNELVADALNKHVTAAFIRCAAANTATNDRRSEYLHSCNGAIISAAVLFLVAYLAFYFGDLDRGKVRSPTEVRITKPVDVRIEKEK